MTTRLLPPDDWARLETTSLRECWRDLYAKRETTVIVVAEDDDGQIIGHAVIASLVHVDGFASNRPSTAWAVLAAVGDYCEAHGLGAVVSSVYSNAGVERLLRRWKSRPLPGVPWLWYPTAKRTRMRERSSCDTP